MLVVRADEGRRNPCCTWQQASLPAIKRLVLLAQDAVYSQKVKQRIAGRDLMKAYISSTAAAAAGSGSSRYAALLYRIANSNGSMPVLVPAAATAA